MNKLTSVSLLIGAALATSSSLWAIASIDADTKLFVTVKANAQYNDNLFLSDPKDSDTLLEAAPGFLFQFGESSMIKGQLFYNENFQYFTDHDDLNTSLSKVGANATYDDGKNMFKFDGKFEQANQATRDVRQVGTLVKRDLITAGALDEFRATEKSSVSLGVDYDKTNYKKAGYVDYAYLSVPVKYYYRFQPKLDVSAGYRYRANDLGKGGVDSDNHFYSVGLRGELTPKLTGELNVGVDQLKPDTGGSETGFGLEADLVYAYSPKTSVFFGGNSGYSYSALGDSTENKGVHAGVSAAVTEDVRLGATGMYTRYSYLESQRDDDFYMLQLSATYTVSENVSLTAAYAYSDNDSNARGATFKDNIVSLSANLKF